MLKEFLTECFVDSGHFRNFTVGPRSSSGFGWLRIECLLGFKIGQMLESRFILKAEESSEAFGFVTLWILICCWTLRSRVESWEIFKFEVRSSVRCGFIM